MDDVVLVFPCQSPSGRAVARKYRDRCQMHHREGTRRNRLHLVATAGLLLLSACTGGNAAEPPPTATSSAPTDPITELADSLREPDAVR